MSIFDGLDDIILGEMKQLDDSIKWSKEIKQKFNKFLNDQYDLTEDEYDKCIIENKKGDNIIKVYKDNKVILNDKISQGENIFKRD